MTSRVLTAVFGGLGLFLGLFLAGPADAQPDSRSNKLLSDQWLTTAPPAEWLTDELLTQLFPAATHAGGLEGNPPAAEVFQDDVPLGYAFLTMDVTESLGFASTVFTIAVGLALDGNLTGVRIIEHTEPIMDMYMMVDEVPQFSGQYGGLDIRRPWRVRLSKASEEGSIDGISSATISAILFNEAIFRAARLVARSRGIRLNDKPVIDLLHFTRLQFNDLVADGSIARMAVTRQHLEAADPAALDHIVPADVPVVDEMSDDLLVELFAAPVMTPTIGRNVLSDNWYNLFVGGRNPNDLVLALMSRGPYSIDGQKHLYTGPFKRVRVKQGDQTFILDKEQYRFLGFLHGPDKPKFTELGLFWIPAESGIEALHPWTIELTIDDEIVDEPMVFSLHYELADKYIIQPTGIVTVEEKPVAMWQLAWETQAWNVAILSVALIILTLILIFMAPLTRHERLYRWIRYGFLAFTLIWMGWTVGAQVTIVNVLTWLQSAIGDFNVDVFLADPLIIVIMGFTVVTFIFWGRGIFCGWLCPFGALQELAAKIAQAIRLPQIELSPRAHKMLWPVKYVILAVLVGLSFYSMAAANKGAEIEPFKTAISLHFVREWPYVVYAATLVMIGLTIERFFCRFICPLGAFMAIGGKLRIINPLKRRAECGSPCHLCERKCPIAAIEPSGKINMTECFYCLDCQIVYYDEHVCPPLINARKVRGRATPDTNAIPAPAAAE